MLELASQTQTSFSQTPKHCHFRQAWSKTEMRKIIFITHHCCEVAITKAGIFKVVYFKSRRKQLILFKMLWWIELELQMSDLLMKLFAVTINRLSHFLYLGHRCVIHNGPLQQGSWCVCEQDLHANDSVKRAYSRFNGHSQSGSLRYSAFSMLRWPVYTVSTLYKLGHLISLEIATALRNC